MTKTLKQKFFLAFLTGACFFSGCTLDTTEYGMPDKEDTTPNFTAADDDTEFDLDTESVIDTGSESSGIDTGKDIDPFPSCMAPGATAPIDEGVEGYCDEVAVFCEKKNHKCVNFQCVDLDDRCRSNTECPSGYECVCPSDGICLKRKCRPVNKECTFDRDCGEGLFCDFGSCVGADQCMAKSIDLRGAFTATSTLHLGVAGDSVGGKLISATQWLRDLLDGGGIFPGLSDVISGVIRTFLMYNVPAYQIDLLFSLVDIAEILETVQIDHQMTLDAPCREMYQGELTFENITLQYKGQVFTERFENITAIGSISPAEIGASLQCNTLAIDTIKIDNLASGSARYATDVLTQVITKGHYQHLEDALSHLIDCNALATYVNMTLPIPGLSFIIQPACRLAVDKMTDAVTKTLIDKPSITGWVKLQGETEIVSDRQMEGGHLFGDTLTDEFTGDFTASR